MSVSATRLYLGNVPRNATKADIEAHFETHGTGKIVEIKLMNGFGFIEYEDEMDARDVVPAFHGSDFMGQRLTVQFARSSRPQNAYANNERPAAPHPRRTPHRMAISGFPPETSWQDLKDFARRAGLDVVYSETGRDRNGKGFVEYESAPDLRTAIEKLDGTEFKGVRVSCFPDTTEDRPRQRYRSRSPYSRYGEYPPASYERRPRGYTPPSRSSYRERSPPPPMPRRGYYDSRERFRSPHRPRGPPDEGYPPAIPPPRRPYPEDPYDVPGPRRGYEADPYMNGHGRPYDRPPSPRGAGRPRSPPRGYHDYERRGAYW